MRPLDVVILLKVSVMSNRSWLQKDIAQSLFVSNSEVSESLHRSQQAGLLNDLKQSLFKNNLLDFLQYGLKYVFPTSPGGLVKGVPTAHSAPMLTGNFVGQMTYVWADPDGEVNGHEVEPLYSTVPKACQLDPKLYELIALADMLRIGRAREVKLAVDRLQTLILSKEDG